MDSPLVNEEPLSVSVKEEDSELGCENRALLIQMEQDCVFPAVSVKEEACDDDIAEELADLGCVRVVGEEEEEEECLHVNPALFNKEGATSPTSADTPDAEQERRSVPNSVHDPSSPTPKPVRDGASPKKVPPVFPCDICGKKFGQSHGLKIHQRVHTGEVPYGCPDCGRRFSQLENLKRHRRVHTGEKPFFCPDCGKRFRESGSHQSAPIPLRDLRKRLRTEPAAEVPRANPLRREAVPLPGLRENLQEPGAPPLAPEGPLRPRGVLLPRLRESLPPLGESPDPPEDTLRGKPRTCAPSAGNASTPCRIPVRVRGLWEELPGLGILEDPSQEPHRGIPVRVSRLPEEFQRPRVAAETQAGAQRGDPVQLPRVREEFQRVGVPLETQAGSQRGDPVSLHPLPQEHQGIRGSEDAPPNPHERDPVSVHLLRGELRLQLPAERTRLPAVKQEAGWTPPGPARVILAPAALKKEWKSLGSSCKFTRGI